MPGAQSAVAQLGKSVDDTPSLQSGPDPVEGSSSSESCAARASLGRSALTSNGWPRSVSTTLAVLSINSLALPTASVRDRR
jgi:hypothetical protein